MKTSRSFLLLSSLILYSGLAYAQGNYHRPTPHAGKKSEFVKKVEHKHHNIMIGILAPAAVIGFVAMGFVGYYLANSFLGPCCQGADDANLEEVLLETSTPESSTPEGSDHTHSMEQVVAV